MTTIGSPLSGSATPQDNRRHQRLPCAAETVVRFHGNLPAFPRDADLRSAKLSDVSRGGLRLVCDCQLYPQERIEVAFGDKGMRQLLVRRSRRIGDGRYEVGCSFV